MHNHCCTFFELIFLLSWFGFFPSTDSVQYYRSDNWRVTQSILTKYNQLGMMMTDKKKEAEKSVCERRNDILVKVPFCCGLLKVYHVYHHHMKLFIARGKFFKVIFFLNIVFTFYYFFNSYITSILFGITYSDIV